MDPAGAADTVGERRGFMGETPAENETGDDEPEAFPLLDFNPKAGEREREVHKIASLFSSPLLT